jgi:carboxymethylenebutenolidase
MTRRIDCYISLNSPWSHLGAPRIQAIAARHGAELRVFPVDFREVIFPASGGLPLPRRSPQRQAYRLQELRRWREHLGVPLVIAPKHSPFDETTAASWVIAARETLGDALAVALAHRVLKAVWEEEQDCADPAVLAGLARDVGLDAAALAGRAADPGWAARRAADSRDALARGIFGAPTYAIGDELFWGQDRLDFVERYLTGP